jgi:DNA mismatch repair protein MutS
MKPTPMIQQYLKIKEDYQDAILMFRLGDFYEMFLDDAQVASRELEIVLTSREAGKGERMPMCGIPFHAATGYISRLVEKGYKVAICEQVEDPKTTKGLVRREVVRVITPGTLLEDQMLQDKSNNFIAASSCNGDDMGWAVADLSTGEFWTTQFPSSSQKQILEEIQRWRPREVLLSEGFSLPTNEELLVTYKPAAYFQYESSYHSLCTAFQTVTLEGFGCEALTAGITAAGALLKYLKETQNASLEHMTRITTYFPLDYVYMDGATRRNLELVKTTREGDVKGSLLGIIDHTVTAAGGRLLRQWLEQPLLLPDSILSRQRCVECLVKQPTLRENLQDDLRNTYDIQRLLSRLACGSANARDLLALGKTLRKLPSIQYKLQETEVAELIYLANRLNPLHELSETLELALLDDPPYTIKEGGIIRYGYNQELDELLSAAREGRKWVAALEQKEKERTGIRSLKIGFNQVFGYYIEVTRANLAVVPDDYIRKQTLANGERYITEELKTYEEKILGAQERSMALEYLLFQELREKVLTEITSLQDNAQVLAQIDVFAGLAELAVRNRYVAPTINENGQIRIMDGRHPVIEQILGPGKYVPNDIVLDTEENRILLITGPNMAGKSTVARSLLLITLLAQIGSYVPARQADIGIVDRIYARVGASDDLGSGQSTFMVEMTELANIVNTATQRSLILLDEVGRGTSTQDGLAIAWATVEYLHDCVGAKTMFTTHFHQLAVLEDILSGVRNFHVEVKEEDDSFVFLHKLMSGSTDKSYGVEVARLAGLPKPLLRRAKELLSQMDVEDIKQTAATSVKEDIDQLPLFTSDPIRDELTELDLVQFTPLKALNYLFELQQRIGKRGES